MKRINLLVDDDVIEYDPECDLKVLRQGMTEPVRLTFSFSSEWTNRVKVATFWSLPNFSTRTATEYQPQVLKDGKSCIIPVEALANHAFKVQVLGKDHKETFRTTSCTIYLEGGNA